MNQERQYQQAAVAWLSKRKRGMVVCRAGGGKTVIAAEGIKTVVFAKAKRERKVRLGWMANTKEQCDQAMRALSNSFGFTLNIALDIKLACAAAGMDWSDRDVLIVDECHHATAESWRKQIATCNGAVWAFTATPTTGDQERDIELRKMFPERHDVPAEEVAKHLCKARVVFLHDSDPGVGAAIKAEAEVIFKDRSKWAVVELGLKVPGNTRLHKETLKAAGCVWGGYGLFAWFAPSLEVQAAMAQVCGGKVTPASRVGSPSTQGQTYRRALWEACVRVGVVGNQARTRAGIMVARARVEAGHRVLVLVNQVEQAQDVAGQIPGAGVYNSKMAKRKTMVEAFRSGEVPCAVGTSMFDEGADFPATDTLIMLCAGKSAAKAEQRTGRVLRQFLGKDGALIYDFLDKGHPMLERHAKARKALYLKLGYQVDGYLL